MKKFLAIILALVLVCALAVAVSANGASSPVQEGTTGEATAEEATDVVVESALEAEGEAAEHIEIATKELEENADDLSALCADLAEFGDLTVLDIAYVSWGDETAAVIKEKGFVEVKFDTKLAADDVLHVIFNEEANGEWVSLDDDTTVEDGSAIVKLSAQGVIAFLIED